MGLIHAKIKLTNSGDIAVAKRKFMNESDIRSMEINMLVDTGAYMLCINEQIREQLGLDKISEQIAEFADSSIRTLDIVGPVEVHFKNRSTSCRAIVLPGNSEPLLGAIPMEDMDVLIDPKKQELIVNPLHPNIASKPIK